MGLSRVGQCNLVLKSKFLSLAYRPDGMLVCGRMITDISWSYPASLGDLVAALLLKLKHYSTSQTMSTMHTGKINKINVWTLAQVHDLRGSFDGFFFNMTGI